MCLLTEHARALQQVKELKRELAQAYWKNGELEVKMKSLKAALEAAPKALVFPEPPQGTVRINADEAFNLLLPYGINVAGSLADWEYQLMTKEDANRFIKWYEQNAPIKPSDYTPDDLDCDDFGWLMRAFAILWMGGKYLWGYTESESTEPEYSFPNHGFCFLILDDKTVWFADALGVAAPDDEVIEAYPVKCYAAKC